MKNIYKNYFNMATAGKSDAEMSLAIENLSAMLEALSIIHITNILNRKIDNIDYYLV